MQSDIIKVENLLFSYANAVKPALDNISFTVKEGEFVVIAGASGCGKSTLLRCLIGLIPHMYSGMYRGKVIVNGLEVSKSKISDLARIVGIVFQNPENQIFMFSVERDVAFSLENLGFSYNEMNERVKWAMSVLEIEDLAKKAPHELSDGQKQRVALAGVLALKPKILLLDEPTSLLDPYTAKELIEVVSRLNKDLGITVLFVEHRLELLAKHADKLIVLNDGKLVANGSVREVLSNKEVLNSCVSLPTVSKAYLMLKEKNILIGSSLPLTVEEFVNLMMRDDKV
jgi:energy-coupling factor transporter ATP-binding protein EcfA2